METRLYAKYINNNINNNNSLHQIESSFTLNRHRDINLGTYIDFLLKYPLRPSDVKLVKKNLNKTEWEGIMKLKSDETIVIKECDKGGACVITDENSIMKKCIIY